MSARVRRMHPHHGRRLADDVVDSRAVVLEGDVLGVEPGASAPAKRCGPPTASASSREPALRGRRQRGEQPVDGLAHFVSSRCHVVGSGDQRRRLMECAEQNVRQRAYRLLRDRPRVDRVMERRRTTQLPTLASSRTRVLSPASACCWSAAARCA